MRREAGMTLVEVMISTVVLSLLMLALSASLRTFATTILRLSSPPIARRGFGK